MILASLDRIDKSYGQKPLLRKVSLVVRSGQRIGLVGRNGAGKTTLLELIGGGCEPDSGSVSLPKDTKIAYLKQEPTLRENSSLYQEMQVPFSALISLEAQVQAVEMELAAGGNDPSLHQRYGELLELRERWGGTTYNSRIRSVAIGLGFAEADLSKRVKELSGGQKSRAALAQILLTDADLLLLDEPTNHLDISGREFLESYLLRFKGGAVIVSHDRYLLTRVATHIAELHAGALELYHGSYEQYLPQREKNLKRKKKLYEEQREFIRRQEEFIRRHLAGQKTRQAQSRRRMLEKLERLEKPRESEGDMKIRTAQARRLPRKVVKLKEVAKSFNGEVLFQGVNCIIERQDKIGLIGPNGCGKTTFLRLLLNLESPDHGQVLLPDGVILGYYPQEVRFENPSQPLLDYLWEVAPDWVNGEIRTYLGRFLFYGEEVKRPLASFSGGEQSRAFLARLLLCGANFLILDEPTNHLDISSTEVLENFLAEFEGTVLGVSHDRFFLDRFTKKILAFEGSSITEYLGNYSDYLGRQAREKTEARQGWPFPGGPSAKRREKREGKKKMRADKPKRKKGGFKAQQIEKEIKTLETELQGIEEALESETYSTDWARLTTLTREKSELEKKLDELYRKWEELAE